MFEIHQEKLENPRNWLLLFLFQNVEKCKSIYVQIDPHQKAEIINIIRRGEKVSKNIFY